MRLHHRLTQLGSAGELAARPSQSVPGDGRDGFGRAPMTDRKSTRLNSSHSQISYAVFCLKKKKHKFDPPAPLSVGRSGPSEEETGISVTFGSYSLSWASGPRT